MTVAGNIVPACTTPLIDANELGNFELPSYGIRSVMAALVCDPELEDSKVTLIDLEHVDVYVAAILAHEPDLVGMSIYAWSSP